MKINDADKSIRDDLMDNPFTQGFEAFLLTDERSMSSVERIFGVSGGSCEI